MASFNFNSVEPGECTRLVFIANGVGSLIIHLTKIKESESPAETPSADVDELADDLGKIKFFDLIRNYKDESRSVSCLGSTPVCIGINITTNGQ